MNDNDTAAGVTPGAASGPNVTPANSNNSADQAVEDLSRAALNLTESVGVIVFPVVARQKAPALLTRWQEIASADVEQVRAWWAKHPRSNIALLCGARSGVVVVDVDGLEGAHALEALEVLHGALPTTVETQTGRGRHLYFAHPGGAVPNSASKIAEKIDVKADGGYVLAPPSVHPSGAIYQWTPGRKLGEIPLAPMPPWLLALVMKHEHEPSSEQTQHDKPLPATADEWAQKLRYFCAAVAGEVKNIYAAPDGKLNTTLHLAAYKLGGLVAGEGFDPTYARTEILRAALAKEHPERGARATIESGLTDGMSKPLRVSQPATSTGANGHRQAEQRDAAKLSTKPGAIEWIDAEKIFAELAPCRWVARGLHIGPGRPTLLAGYGASAKTLSAQALVLAKAAGRLIWNHFECDPGVVLHLDYEQGRYASIKRYQRLAIGHAIDPVELGNRLRLSVLPRVFLDGVDAIDAYARACDGVDLVVIDALRGAAPESDENDSSVRATLDMLNHVSDRTGSAFVVLHHAGKPKEGHDDARTLARGSSAIFDACGCVLNFVAGKNGKDAKRVSQVKTPAEAEGAAIDDFELLVEDVDANGSATGGVRASWRAAPDVVSPDARAAATYEREANRLLEAIRTQPGATANTIVAKSGINRGRALTILASLTDDGRVIALPGSRGAKQFRLGAP